MQRFVLVALVAIAASGCRVRSSPPVQIAPPVRPAAPARTLPEPTLLSAHFALDDAPSLGDLDAVSVVFSVEVDPASLQPSAFMVVLADGTRAFPTEAVLAPSSEADENRTVLLVGDFGDPRRRPPADVLVIRTLHAETGQSLRGLLGPISGYDEGGRIVAAEQSETPCDAGAQRVRTYWTDALRGVEPADLQAVTVELSGGRTAHPVAFDDHRSDREEREDNVLDLCVPATEQVVSIWVEAGAFTDAPGHLSAATKTTVARAPAPE
ncbi:MAG: hypothetical protein AAGA54_06520 [Myxococcota bacterium]